jgi:hypothetical protein
MLDQRNEVKSEAEMAMGKTKEPSRSRARYAPWTWPHPSQTFFSRLLVATLPQLEPDQSVLIPIEYMLSRSMAGPLGDFHCWRDLTLDASGD